MWLLREGHGVGARAQNPAAYRVHPRKPARPKPGKQAPASALRGTIRDAQTQEPLAGAAVFLRGENRSAHTDSAGHFSLLLPRARTPRQPATLVVHRTGYHSRTVWLMDLSTASRVLLRADSSAAGAEVMGTYVERRVQILGGAIATISEMPTPPQPTGRGRSFFHWLTRPFRR